VVAIQGDYQRHLDSVSRAGGDGTEVRTADDLTGVDRLIIPGGESTTVGLLMQRFGLAEAIQDLVSGGMPVWGTCMGMIMMARAVEGRDQFTLNLLDITVRRNAFGAQVHSFEDHVEFKGLAEGVTGVFIRAPWIETVHDGVEVLARVGEHPVAARQGDVMVTSFHPELTDDTRLHAFFLDTVAGAR